MNIILAGLGGQGVIFLTRLLAQTAVALEQPVMVSETHGMSQRGGSVVSYLKTSGDQSPLILRGCGDVLIALEADEAVRSLPLLRRGGTVFVNSENGLRPEVGPHLERLNIQVHSLAAGRMAVELGSAAVANVTMAGFAAAYPSLPFPIETLRETLLRVARRGVDMNQRALEAGYRAGSTPG